MAFPEPPNGDQASTDLARLTHEVSDLRRKVAELEAARTAETPLEFGDAQFRMVFESAGVGMALANIHGRILQINRSFNVMLGYEPGELKGKMIADITHPEDMAKTRVNRRQTIDREKPFYRQEKRYLTKDGGTIWAQITSTPNFDPDGGFLFSTAVVEDITARRAAEAALQRSESRLADSEARLEEAQRIAHIGNWEFDVRTKKRLMSNECCRIFGQDKDDFDLSDDSLFNCIHPADLERFMDTIPDHDRPRAPHVHEYRIVRPGGDVRTLREHIVFEYDTEERLIRRAGTVQDITELKQAEEQLLQAQKMEAVGQLTGGIAHDFNNLLAVMMGTLEMARDRVGEDRHTVDMIDRGMNAAERGAALTHRLLAFSRKQSLRPTMIDMNTLVADMTEMLRRTLRETIAIDILPAEGLWLCEADQAQLENALLNLAINARDAMVNDGAMVIETGNCVLDDDYVSAWAEVLPGQYVMLSVKDDGGGIPQDTLEHVFEPFFTTKDVGKGSGLGLSMIYGFVKQSGGHVEIDSTEGEGTTVKLFLPRAAAAAEVESV